MRPLEIIFVIAAILCSVLKITRKGKPRLNFLLILATSIIGVVQLLVEGYRTPMLPIYLLVGGLLIYAGIFFSSILSKNRLRCSCLEASRFRRQF
jgi:predicted membrane channel-forming protein YqfA (hemolysin III family)